MSREKDFRGPTPTTNQRFISLMLRWGKKSKSYNVFLNALYQSKKLLDLPNQSIGIGKDTTEILDNDKKDKTQKFPINYPLKKSAKNIVLPSEKVTLEKKRTSVSSLDNNIGIFRGTWNRFRKNLLIFNYSLDNTPTSYIVKKNLEVKVRFSERVYSNFNNLSTISLLDSQLKEEHTFLSREPKCVTQQFCVNKRLINRRVGLKVQAISELLKQSIISKKNDIEDLVFRSLTTDSFILNLATITSFPKKLQSKSSHRYFVLLSSYLKSKEVTNTLTTTRTINEKLIDCVQNSKEQALIKTPLSVLLKKGEHQR